MKPVIRLATQDDVPALLEIEHQSFSNPHWRAKDFLVAECSIAEVEGRPVGFLVSHETFSGSGSGPESGSGNDLPEREILNLAVAPPFRRMGIATTLLRNELRHAALYFLEVRESNLAAQALYRRFGFVATGRRAEYYQRPREGAIVMQMKKC